MSPGGLTWTFRLREGLHYGPLLANHEIVAQDFIRLVVALNGRRKTLRGFVLGS